MLGRPLLELVVPSAADFHFRRSLLGGIILLNSPIMFLIVSAQTLIWTTRFALGKLICTVQLFGAHATVSNCGEPADSPGEQCGSPAELAPEADWPST